MSGGGFERAYQDEAIERVRRETRQTTTLRWGGAVVEIYVDEALQLRDDLTLYGTMYLMKNPSGVHERIPPPAVSPVE